MGKRSRIYRSSSVGEASVLDQIIPFSDPGEVWEKKWDPAQPAAAAPPVVPGPPPRMEMDGGAPPSPANPLVAAVLAGALWKPPPILETPSPPRRRKAPAPVFTLGSPFNEPGPERSGVVAEGGEFLQACFFCRKPMQKNQTIYMFGHLRAFCSPSCQKQQMSLEGFDVDAVYDESEKNASGTCKRSNPRKTK